MNFQNVNFQIVQIVRESIEPRLMINTDMRKYIKYNPINGHDIIDVNSFIYIRFSLRNSHMTYVECACKILYISGETRNIYCKIIDDTFYEEFYTIKYINKILQIKYDNIFKFS